ncbi:MAG TPA: c-type cytochrome, partial [Elusimicrobiota bacterium]|nr:c-type cytochrome [Elusimicrobiota bacterium]
LVCHTAGLINSQRLPREGWAKTVAKMRSFGAVVSAEEEPRIVEYLAKLSAKVAVPPTQPLDYARAAARYSAAAPRGDAQRGARVFARLCANCHGLQGQGDAGPRLAGRAVPQDVFFSVAAYGRGTMPGFGDQLKAGEAADLYLFLQQPTKNLLR